MLDTKLTVSYDYERSELKYDQYINDERSELYRERAQRAVSNTCIYRVRAKRVYLYVYQVLKQ